MQGRSTKQALAALLTTAALILTATATSGASTKEEKIWHHRNLGKALYENPATQYEAVDEFRKALELAPDSARERINYGLSLLRAGKPDEGIVELEKAQKQDPSIPHTWFNLGIAYKRNSDYEKAMAQFERMVELVPDEPISHYNLGVLYKLAGRHEDAMRHFERAAELDPNLAGPHFQLATAYRQAKRMDEAKREMALFREIKAKTADAAVPEDLEWSFYAEIYETIDPENAVDQSPPAKLEFSGHEVATGLDGASAGITELNANANEKPDLIAWSQSGLRLVVDGKATSGGFDGVKNVVAVAAEDFDNDGLADLAVVGTEGATLFRNQGGSFAKHAATLPAGPFDGVLWLDYDHDYDADLFLLGASSALLRNNGEAGFSDQTADFPFVPGRALAGARVDVVADTQGTDLAVIYADRVGVLYRDRLLGQYEATPLPELGKGLRTVVAFYFNTDGWTDLAAGGASSTALLVNTREQSFDSVPVPDGSRAPLVFVDLENRGLSDLVAAGVVYRNQGLGRFTAGKKPAELPAATALASADLNADGRLDLAAIDAGGALRIFRNETSGSNTWLKVGLEGVKNMKLAPGAEIEVKAGTRYQKKIYRGVPLHFGLGQYAEVDTVRITWPNGLIQNEARQATGQTSVYKEAQRLSGSCPMIFTWNGAEFEFITDVLGVAPLGASAGDGEYFPTDHDEYIQIAGSSLVPRDGKYEIRITEELREVAYLDEIRLIAVDRPAEIDIFTNDKFKGPPFPEFRLFGVRDRVYPQRATDHHGRDVRQHLLARDRSYPAGFARDYAGRAEFHHLELDFGRRAAASDRAILVLSGWVDWADGSTFLNASQQSDAGLVMPQLQVKDEHGEWQTVIEDMGIPAGKPKTIVVDLTNKFLSASREVRILTNLCVYWDEIFLSEETAAPPVRLTELHPEAAGLGFRGFSKVVIHPERKQPEHFVYAEWRPLSMWNPTRGLYTRYGDVRPLLTKIDDLFVIMGSGDELQLRFDAEALPELEPGQARDFLLFVDGWAKDGDANTAYSQTVGPLPYHDMPQYPYAEPDTYPTDGVHQRYQEFYNVRPALRLIRPLTEGLSVDRGAE